ARLGAKWLRTANGSHRPPRRAVCTVSTCVAAGWTLRTWKRVWCARPRGRCTVTSRAHSALEHDLRSAAPGKKLPEGGPWLTQERPFADFQDFSQVFRDYSRPATDTPEAVGRHAFAMIEGLACQNVR